MNVVSATAKAQAAMATNSNCAIGSKPVLETVAILLMGEIRIIAMTLGMPLNVLLGQGKEVSESFLHQYSSRENSSDDTHYHQSFRCASFCPFRTA